MDVGHTATKVRARRASIAMGDSAMDAAAAAVAAAATSPAMRPVAGTPPAGFKLGPGAIAKPEFLGGATPRLQPMGSRDSTPRSSGSSRRASVAIGAVPLGKDPMEFLRQQALAQPQPAGDGLMRSSSGRVLPAAMQKAGVAQVQDKELDAGASTPVRFKRGRRGSVAERQMDRTTNIMNKAFREALQTFEQKEWDSARGGFTTLISMLSMYEGVCDVSLWKCHYCRGVCYAESDMYEQGWADFDMCVREDEDAADGYKKRALCALELGLVDQAAADSQRAFEMEPTDAETQSLLARLANVAHDPAMQVGTRDNISIRFVLFLSATASRLNNITQKQRRSR